MCVCVCEYLVIWCDKTTVHEIIDCSSIHLLQILQIMYNKCVKKKSIIHRVLVGARIFTSPCCPDQFWGPPTLLSSGYPWIKRPAHEADHTPPTSAKDK
jgi:hypothetical protein